MRFFKDLKKYYNYAAYSAAAELKSQVASNYLGWLWWILDPLLFMFVYTFIVKYVFRSTDDNLSLMVFTGLTAWNFFSGTVQSSVSIIRSYRSVLQKVYLPKFILVLMNEMINFIKMMIGIGLCIIVALISGIPVTFNILLLFPIIAVYFILTFGISLICAHIGVYIADFSNIMTVMLRLLFYLSGVFYKLSTLPEKLLSVYNMLCPTGVIIDQFRLALGLSGSEKADYLILLYWLTAGIIFSAAGLYLTYKHENNYMKVI